jgi:acetyl-CoA acetyltransferase
MSLKRVAVVGGKRIPFARSFTKYMGIPNQELMTASLKAVVETYGLNGEQIGEVVLGAVIKHSGDWNLARECAIGSGLSAYTPAYDLVQACGTSLQAAIAVSNKIALGQIEAGIAGGVDTNSDLPFVFPRTFNHTLLAANREKTTGGKLKQFLKLRPADLKPQMPGVVEPRTGLSMGQSCEKMAKDWKVTRQEQDELAYASQMNAAKAWKDGFYKDMVVGHANLDFDNNVRGDTTLEKMAAMKPAFDRSSEGAHRRLGRRSSGQRRVGQGSRSSDPGLHHSHRDRGRRFRQSRRLADGTGVCGRTHAHQSRLKIAGLRFLRNSRSLRRASAVHAESVGERSVLPRALEAERRFGLDRPRENERQRRIGRARPPVRRDRRTHHSHAG